jgi:anaerobic ribonucleoside-triphosphate reductase activating protein
VLIDGPFLLAERSLDLHFKGSRNQRTIDVQKSMEKREVVLWEDASVQ